MKMIRSIGNWFLLIVIALTLLSAYIDDEAALLMVPAEVVVLVVWNFVTFVLVKVFSEK